MLNIVNLQGHLIDEPNFRITPNGVSYCSIVIAIERPKGNSTSRLSDIIPCVAWGKTAEYINKTFHKGDMVVVGGHLQSREFTDSRGAKSVAYEVKINECNSVDCKSKSNVKEVDDDIDWDNIPKIVREY